MDGNILKQAFQMMDNAGTTSCGVDTDRNEYYPSTIIGGYIYQIIEESLQYISNLVTCWGAGLGALYGTTIY